MAEEMYFLSKSDRDLVQRLLTLAKSGVFGSMLEDIGDPTDPSAPILMAKLPEGEFFIPPLDIASGNKAGKIECEVYALNVDDITTTDMVLAGLIAPNEEPSKLWVYNPYPCSAVFLEAFRITRLAGGGFICETPKPFLCKPVADIAKDATGTAIIWRAGTREDPAYDPEEMTDAEIEVFSPFGELKADKFAMVTPTNGKLVATTTEC